MRGTDKSREKSRSAAKSSSQGKSKSPTSSKKGNRLVAPVGEEVEILSSADENDKVIDLDSGNPTQARGTKRTSQELDQTVETIVESPPLKPTTPKVNAAANAPWHTNPISTPAAPLTLESVAASSSASSPAPAFVHMEMSPSPQQPPVPDVPKPKKKLRKLKKRGEGATVPPRIVEDPLASASASYSPDKEF